MLLEEPTDQLKSIRSQLLAEVQDKRLELPTLPESRARIESIVCSEVVDLRVFKQALILDPGLASQLIRVANSPPYLVARPVSSIAMAIKQLGVRNASELALGFASRLVFQPTNEMIERRFRQGVSDARFVSAAAAVFARNFTEISPECARVAGLVHNLGVLPILAQAEYLNIIDTFALENIVDAVQVSLGSSILKRWNFSEDVAEIPQKIAGHERSQIDPGLLDLVVVAVQLNAYFNSNDTVAESTDSTLSISAPKMCQSLSMMIYEFAGFDPVANVEQVTMLRREILEELSGSGST